jgi:hypothetical protein
MDPSLLGLVFAESLIPLTQYLVFWDTLRELA